MRILLTTLFSLIIGVVFAQRTAPTSLPSPNSTGYSKVGFYRGDSAFLMGPRLDTNWIPVTQALITFKPIGADTGRLFYYDGRKWKEANKIDTSSLSNRINLKVDSVSVSTDSFYYWVNGNPNFFYKNVDSFYYTIQQLDDTSALILRSDGIVDTLAITSGDASLSLDTTSLSNRINLKLNISDTTAMLSPYLRYAYRTPGVDSIYFVKGDGSVLAVKDSAGGGGITGTLNDSRLVYSANGEVKDTSTLIYNRASGNVGIGGTPDASAQLDVSSTTKGFLPPRMTTAERNAIASPASGLVVYNTTEKRLNERDDSTWHQIATDDELVFAQKQVGSSFTPIAFPIGMSSIAGTATGLSDAAAGYTAFYVKYNCTITGVRYYTATKGAFTADNENAIKLYSLSNGVLTEIAATANDGNIWKQANGTWASAVFTNPVNVKAGLYYVGIIYNNSAQTTAPQLLFNNQVATVPIMDNANGVRLSGARTGMESMVSGETWSNITVNSRAPLMYLY